MKKIKKVTNWSELVEYAEKINNSYIVVFGNYEYVSKVNILTPMHELINICISKNTKLKSRSVVVHIVINNYVINSLDITELIKDYNKTINA